MQTPAPFEYERAVSVDHALALLERHGPEARLIAGGHSLLPMMKLRLSRPEVLVDINDLTDLSYVRVDGDTIAIGAMTRHAELLESPCWGSTTPSSTTPSGSSPTRRAQPWDDRRFVLPGRPAEELAAVGAASGPSGGPLDRRLKRTRPGREFHAGPYETGLDPAEILTEVRAPIRPGAGSAYEKVERRVGDWAIAAAGASCPWTATRWATGDRAHGRGARPLLRPRAEDVLRGKASHRGEPGRRGRRPRRGVRPGRRQRGPVDYKRHLARELTVRALRRSAASARGKEDS